MKIVRVDRAFYFPVLVCLAVFLSAFSTVRAADEVGKTLFEGKCARCHAKDGTGDAKMAKLLKVSLKKINLHRDEVLRMSSFQIETMIDTGKHRMPKYRGKLTDMQIHDVAQYVKILTGNVSQEDNETPK